MKISKKKFENISRNNSLTLKELLKKSGVSKTAYYNLLYKDKLLPNSVYALADALGVMPSDFLEEVSPEEKKIYDIIKLTDEIIGEYPDLDRDNVRHTLLLLEEEPVERLKRGLIRGRKFNIYR